MDISEINPVYVNWEEGALRLLNYGASAFINRN